MNSKRRVIPRRHCKIAPTSPRSTRSYAAASGPVKRSAYKDDYYDFKDVELKPTPSKNHSDLVRRRHTGFLPPRGGLLRRLDAWTYSHGDV